MNHRGCQYRITLEISFNLTLARLKPIFLCFTPIFSSYYFFWPENCLFSNNNKNQINRTVLRNRKVSISQFLCIALTRIAIYRCFFPIVVSEQGSKKKYVGKVIEYCFDVMMTATRTAMWSIIPLRWTFSLVSHRVHITNVSIQWWSVNYANWLYSDTFLASAIFTSCPSNQCV